MIQIFIVIFSLICVFLFVKFLLYRIDLSKAFHLLGSFNVEKQEDYFKARINSWILVQGRLSSISIATRTVFVGSGEKSMFFLKIKIIYRLEGKILECTFHPYEFGETQYERVAQKLKRSISDNESVNVYCNPIKASQSFFIYNQLFSWCDVEEFYGRS